MRKPVHLDDEAKAELAADVEWYDGVRAGLGREFLESVRDSLTLIEEVPGVGTAVAGVPTDLGVRKLLLPRFPYAIVFLELPAEVRVIAIAHGRRKPGYWRQRLR